jgi:hypothetical protein
VLAASGKAYITRRPGSYKLSLFAEFDSHPMLNCFALGGNVCATNGCKILNGF